MVFNLKPSEVTFRNLTPHEVTLCIDGGQNITYPVDGPPPRVTTIENTDGFLHDDVNDLDVEVVVRSLSSTVTDLPAPKPGVILIVSRMTCEAKSQRTDLVYPEGIVRSPDNTPIGCRKFGRVRPTG
jgi:hypothetical protein